MTQIWKWIGLIGVVGFMIFNSSNLTEKQPKGQSVQSQLEGEFKNIKPLPGANAFGYNATHKTSQAFVGSEYKTKLPYQKIRAYYDIELTKRGWVFYEQEQMRDWGRDFGGTTARYCKGEYRADLQYAGERANYEWDYAFSMSWGLDSLVEKYSDKFSQVGCR